MQSAVHSSGGTPALFHTRLQATPSQLGKHLLRVLRFKGQGPSRVRRKMASADCGCRKRPGLTVAEPVPAAMALYGWLASAIAPPSNSCALRVFGWLAPRQVS